MNGFWHDWSDGKKWTMGILSALVIATVIGGFSVLRSSGILGGRDDLGIWSLSGGHLRIVFSAKSVAHSRRFGNGDMATQSEDGHIQPIKLSDVVEAVFAIAKRVPKKTLESAELYAGDLDPDQFKGSDVIVLGGPVANYAFDRTLQALERSAYAVPYKFGTNVQRYIGGDIAYRDSIRSIVAVNGTDTWTSSYEPVQSSSGTATRVTADHAMYFIVPNPFDNQRLVILVAGCHKIGTDAAIDWLTDKRTSAELRRQRDAGIKYQAGIIAIDVVSEIPTRVHECVAPVG